MSESPPQPGQVYRRALEPFWKTVSIYEGPAVFCEQFDRLPREIGVLFAAHWLNSEVCNGGFHQFFSNPTGVLAPEAHTAFRALELEQAAAIIQQAISFFGPDYPREQEDRCVMLDSIPGDTRAEYDPFYALDPLYFELLPSATRRFQLAADTYAKHNVA
jgi:hypothetical protein